MEAAPGALEEITQVVRQWLLHVPHDHPIDAALDPSYLRRFAKSNRSIQPGDGIEVRSVDLSWLARLLVVSVSSGTSAISTKLMLPPTFLLGHGDRSPVHILERINDLERDYQLGKIRVAEYEARLRTLHTVRDHGRYPTEALRRRLAELDRARDAGLLTQQQHAQAAGELLPLLGEDTQPEPVGGEAATEKAAKKKPAPVTS